MSVPTVIKPVHYVNPKFVSDIFEPMTPGQLQAEWAKNINPANLVLRDSLLDVMKRKSVRPDTWLVDRNTTHGLYPDMDDPDFTSRLIRKTEFSSLASVMAEEDTCTASKSYFETTPVQRLVARFLHPSTPYRGLLLNHGVGVGKTCSAITVAETFLDIVPNNTVYILAPQAIADGFKRTIFDKNRLVKASKAHFKLTGERWESPQCTGMTYLRLTGTAASESRDDIEKEVDKKVRTRYMILGYLAFHNWLQRKFKTQISDVVTGTARRDRENEIILSLFSDHLMIIDEAHNLRDDSAASEMIESDVDEPDGDEAEPSAFADAAAGKKLTPTLKRVLSVAEGLRVMLMTATPMYNVAPEIIFLLDLLTLNDTKDESKLLSTRIEHKTLQIFERNGNLTTKGEEELAVVARRYVSYMRGENPNTFPLRLTPPDIGGAAFMDAYPTVSISRKEGAVVLTENDKRIMAQLPLCITNVSAADRAGQALIETLGQHTGPAEGRVDSEFILDKAMQIGNITYPSGIYGTKGWETHFKSEESTAPGGRRIKGDERGGKKVKAFSWNPPPLAATMPGVAPPPLPTLESVFAGAGLASHAPKIARIVDSITRAKGISFVYSRYVKAGALPLAIALELRGWCRVLADGTPAPLLKRSGAVPAPKFFYILLTSDEEISPNFNGLIEYATTFKTTEEALLGKKVKAIIGSQVASEGLDLKCIRELHILDGWYHLNRIEQIEGRGVRFCSHVALPLEERNCLLYLHALNTPVIETADLYAYRLAVRKAQPVGRVSRLMKINAWDCMLNMDAILLKDLPRRNIVDAQGRSIPNYDLQDKPYTSFCDFMDKCEYICGSRPVPAAEVGKNVSTYKEFDFRSKFLEKQLILKEIYRDEVAEPLEKIRTVVYGDMPWSIGAIGLREALGKLRIKRDDGIYGTLILQNGYVVFQPDRVTDTMIPIAMRYGRAFGRLPRTIELERGTLLQAAAPAPAPAAVAAAAAEGIAEAAAPVAEIAVAAPAADAAAARVLAISMLDQWYDTMQRIISTPVGIIAEPSGFSEMRFQGWRWVFHHFGELEETVPLACHWFMDNVWTTEQRRAVFSEWLERGGAALSPREKMYASTFKTSEFFRGELSGFLLYDIGGKALQKYCYISGMGPPSTCSVDLETDFDAVVGKPLNRSSDDVGSVFGLLVNKSGNVVFKSADKESGRLDGAECANTSNLANHEQRIREIHKNLRDFLPAEHILRSMLLGDDPASSIPNKDRVPIQDAVKARYDMKTKVADPSLHITHVSHLSVKQSCPYIEFLLRWMDNSNVGGKRWFLSLVDSARAGVRMA